MELEIYLFVKYYNTLEKSNRKIKKFKRVLLIIIINIIIINIIITCGSFVVYFIAISLIMKVVPAGASEMSMLNCISKKGGRKRCLFYLLNQAKELLVTSFADDNSLFGHLIAGAGVISYIYLSSQSTPVTCTQHQTLQVNQCNYPPECLHNNRPQIVAGY